MKDHHLIIALLILIFSFQETFSQNDIRLNNNDFSYGFGVKLNVEFSYKNTPDFKLGITGGLSYNAIIENSYGISPTIHAGLLFFNSRSIGANQAEKWYKVQSHGFLNTTCVFQLDKLDFNPLLRPVPMYHFAEFTANPLQNPFKSSFSFGLNRIFVHDKILQRTGFFNLNVAGRVQVSYYNDGGPILNMIGDRLDRFYTGGIVFSYHGDLDDSVNLVELSYHKFTGYQKYAFDVAEQLQIDFVNYSDTTQFEYNQQRWRLNVTSLEHGFGGSLSLYNYNRLDVQDFIHLTTNVPYHPDYFEKPRWMVGGQYQYNNTNF